MSSAADVTTARGSGTPRHRERTRFPLSTLVKAEVLQRIRVPGFVISTLIFPMMFFAFFGLPNLGRRAGGADVGAYMMASYGAYAVMSVALISFGVSISAERGLGWNKLLRASPMDPLAYFVAKVLMALVLGFLALALLFAFAAIVGHVSLPITFWVKITALLITGMVPFVALGLAIGYLASPTAAAPIANLISLPLSFASGLFVPLQFLPPSVQHVAPYLPSYHVAELGWTLLGAGDGMALGGHFAWIGGYAVAFMALAVIAYRRDEGRTFG
jgi:ABC-2 type transport system permease protein